MTNETWGTVRQHLKETVGYNNFQSWIEPLEFERLGEDGVAVFRVPSQFVGNWVSRNYGDTICDAIRKTGSDVRRLSFTVQTARRADPALRAKEEPVPADTDVDEASSGIDGASLDPKFTFDSFVVGKPNELAHAAARRVAEGEGVAFNPLLLYGGVGLGKTHLMHAIAWELRRRRPEKRILYLSAEQFMYRFIQALRERNMIDFKQMFRSVDVLIVDDVQFIAGKDSTQEEFFHTFNALVDQNKQIIISSDRAPGEIPGLESRIVSRLQSGLSVDVHPTTYELRLGILQQKLGQFQDQFPGTEIENGVLEFLAQRITANVRVLEGALMRLFAFGSLVGRQLDLTLTQECLKDILKHSDKQVTIDEIQRKVCDHYNIRISDLVGPKRSRVFARPRQVAMFLSKELTSRSLPEIGRKFGKRDHTTIMHGVRKIEELRQTDRQIAEDLDMLRRALAE
jgi:chromosomal replication initiator protein